ncbi:MAG: hypothetical protein SCM96_07675 [Acidobacteriota bacterium]|nr:hypothetical protein [Acidobacteriota bacterium]
MKSKTTAMCVLIGILAGMGSVAAAPAVEKNDLQIIRKAVRDNGPDVPSDMKEVKWFRVLVTDNRTNKDKVRISLPFALLEAVSKIAAGAEFRFDRKAGDVELGALLAELKKIGPMAIIEVHDENETIKVWFE